MPRDRFSLTVSCAAMLLFTGMTEAVVVIQLPTGEVSAYTVDMTLRTWTAAKSRAESTQYAGVTGQLATINSWDEQRWVQQLASTGDRWIGLSDNEAFGGVEGGNQSLLPPPVEFAAPVAGEKGAGWRWVDGQPLTFQYWRRGEPSDAGGNEDAVVLRDTGVWNDDNMNLGKPSVIEYELASLPTDVFKVTLVKQYNGVTNLAVADAVIAGDIASVETIGSFTLFDLLDTGNPGFVGLNQPVPGMAQGVDESHFVSRSVASLNVQSSGVYTFVLGSDDGGRLVLDGQTIAEFYGSRPFEPSVSVPVNLTAGAHELEIIWFESTGDAGAEVGYAAGAEGFLNPNFTILGDPSRGIALSGPIQSTTYDVQLETLFGLEFGLGLTHVEAADRLLAGLTPGVKWEFFSDVINFNDLETPRTGDKFGNDDSFPGLMATDQDRFILHATGFVEITEAGDYTFGMRHDDGARLRIDGRELINETSQSTTLASIFLAPGFHFVEVTMGDDGGRGTIELFAAQGLFTDFDPQAFRLVGDVPGGGLRVTQAPQQIAVPEPGTTLIVLAACMLSLTRRRLGPNQVLRTVRADRPM